MSNPTVGNSNPPLFRYEALKRFSGTAWQPPLLSRPVSACGLAALALIAAATFIAFAASFEFARKEQVRGFLTPADGWSRVTAKSFGVVRRRLADPGDDARTGDVLLEISPGDGVQQALTVQDRMLEEIQGRQAALKDRIHLVERDYEQEADLRHFTGSGGDAIPGVMAPLFGATDVDVEAVGAVRVGDLSSTDPAAPGVLVIESDTDQGPSILLRFGSDANRRDMVRFDGGFMVLEVRELGDNGFSGTWASGAQGAQTRGHFCSERRSPGTPVPR